MPDYMIAWESLMPHAELVLRYLNDYDLLTGLQNLPLDEREL